jgi:peptidoglycan hydrolase-like protein with peptidoglycan-binding domain
VPDGNFGAETREAIRQAKTAANASRVAKQAPPLFKSVNNQIDTEKESQIFLAVQQCELDRSGTDRAYATAFEKFRFADENAIKELQKTLAKCAPNANVTQTGIFDKATREGISAATGMKGSTVAKTNKLNETSYEWVSGVCI